MIFTDTSDRSVGIYNVPVMTGYLTAVRTDEGVGLQIPNREMFECAPIRSSLGVNGLNGKLRELFKTIPSCDVQRIGSILGDILMATISGRVLNYEHSYQAFTVGPLMNLFENYSITADLESEEGYHDIRLVRRSGSGSNIVMEFKRVGFKGSEGRSPEELAYLELQQIHDRRHYHGMEETTVLYVVAFDLKVPTIVSEELVL